MYDLNSNPQPRKRLVTKDGNGGGCCACLGRNLWIPGFSQRNGLAAKPAASRARTAKLVDSSCWKTKRRWRPYMTDFAVGRQHPGRRQCVTVPSCPKSPASELPQDTPNQPQTGEGSGFIYDNEGHIVTNNHVVEGATKVVVIFSNGMWAKADVVATDPQADLAVVKVTPPAGMEWKPLAVADDGTLKVGHTVIAIGNPFGLENTMTTGIVSALGRCFPTGAFGASRYSLPDVIQTDAAINPGNSGGPLLDLNGNVVGVNFAIESAPGSNSGVGFAIPVSIVKRVVPELIKDGKFNYAYLGLQGSTITPQLAETLGLETTSWVSMCRGCTRWSGR